MNESGLGVGDLARSSGLSIRAVRYYDQIGLLTPSWRSAAGHRRYADADVRRLYRIALLRRLGLPLAEIAKALDEPDTHLRSAMAAHLDLLDRRQAVEAGLRGRLTTMIAAADAEPPDTTELLETLEAMAMLDDDLVQRRISILVYEDLAGMHDWLVRTFGLRPGQLHRDGEGRCVHAEVHAGDGVIWLHQVSPDFRLSSPRRLGAATAMTAVMVEDVDAHHVHARDEGAEIVYPPVDQPYGFREYSARDPEGGLWSFMKALA